MSLDPFLVIKGVVLAHGFEITKTSQADWAEVTVHCAEMA
jgi:hypothetical protein